MLLTIDVGNTNTTIAVFRNHEIQADWRVSTDVRRTADEYQALFTNLFQQSGVASSSIQGVCISSVVPGAIDPLRKFSKKYLGIENPLVLSSSTNIGIKVHYSPPSDVGADRLANAAAAYDTYGGPAIIVDFGTATTFDAVSVRGEYLGGAIAAGIEISVEALVAHAAKLRRMEFAAPPNAIGTTTAESLQSGIVFGFAAQVDGMVERFCAEIGDSPTVIATGGLAELIAPHTRTIEKIDPLLTLHGLRIIFERST